MRRFLLLRISRGRTAVLVFAFVGLALSSHAQTITTFDVPNSTNTIPQSNNLFGHIAGYYQDANFVVHGFLRHLNGSIITLDPVGSTGTYVTAINDLGQVTGYYFAADYAAHGFVRKWNGAITTFDAPNSPYPPAPDLCEWQTTDTNALAINLVGKIAGTARQHLVGLNGNICAGLRYIGFLRDRNGNIITFGITWAENVDAEFVSAKSINLSGKIAGYFQSTDLPTEYFHAGFLRQPDGSITIFGDQTPGSYLITAAINRFDQITGYYQDTNVLHGFLREPDGTMVTFDPAGSTDTEPTAINLWGQITGHYLAADNAAHGFMRKWNGDIITFDVPSAAGTFPQDINLGGQITGYYQDTNLVLHGFIRSAH